jgi:flagellar motor switch protein FliN/FliY
MSDERNNGPEDGGHETEWDDATRAVGPEQDLLGYRTEMMTGASDGPASLLDRLELPIEVRFGKLEWELERVLGLRVGESVPIGPDRDDSVTLYVQGRPYAVGDLVVVEGRFGFRVRELLRNE